MAAAAARPWPRLPGRRAGHLTRLRAKETQEKSLSPPSELSPPLPPPAASNSPPPPSLQRHAVRENLQTAPNLRTKSRRCPTYPRAASYQNPGRKYGKKLMDLSRNAELFLITAWFKILLKLIC
ncbi:microtubule-associated proteins 1A/1B light chain 3B isoform X2 [Bos mutus]|uniref:microtubule-associated proteins 1A/1B light chain 3B isoform X2 n=1 Tax=Bos mutus TaxID=72004 RepID=UPI0038B5600C